MRNALGEPIHFACGVTTDAVREPLSMDDVREMVNVETHDDDGKLARFLSAARKTVERDTGQACLTQTWTMTLDSAPAGRVPIVLPVWPVQSVSSITSYSTADVSSTVASSVYRLDTTSRPARIVLKDGQAWPSGLRPENALAVTFVSGYGDDAEDITEPGLTQAIALLVAHWYRQREPVIAESGVTVSQVPLAYTYLVQSLAVPWVG